MSDVHASSFDRFVVRFKAGEVIFCEYEPGDRCYVFRSGSVKLFRVVGAREKTVGILRAGDILGEMALIGGVPRSATAVALENCEALVFTQSTFSQMMSADHAMGMRLLRLFARRISEQKRQRLILSLEDDADKVADVLVMLGDEADVAVSDTGFVDLNITKEGIANWAGLEPDKVMGILNVMAEQKKINQYADKIRVNHINEMRRQLSSKRKQEG